MNGSFKASFQRPRRHPQRRGPVPDGLQQLWGLHTVEAALKNPRRRLRQFYATANAWHKLQEAGCTAFTPEIVRPAFFSTKLPASAVHQGVLLECEPLEPIALEAVETHGIVIALDQVTDPHNVGAILRTAAAFNVRALIVTQRHSAEFAGVLAKSASGALDLVPFCVVKNLRECVADLRARGFTALALDSEAEHDVRRTPCPQPLLLVLGAEGKGVRQGVREACTTTARLDLPGAIKSLNVSNAAAVALSVIQKPEAKDA